MARFKNRDEAGALLADALLGFRGSNSVVLALPRGGVPVACEVAKELRLPLDVLVVRKLGAPGNEEFAFGAISEAGSKYINQETARALGLTEEQIEAIVSRESNNLQKRIRALRGLRPITSLVNKTALIVDDGLATGATAIAAVLAARRLGAAKAVIAVPICPMDVSSVQLGSDDLTVLSRPQAFRSVGEHYDTFEQVSDQQVSEILEKSRSEAI
jgi:putative phosphoribosyl transferase